MNNPLEKLKNRLFSGNKSTTRTILTDIVDLSRGLSCLGDIIGRQYEIRDQKGKLVYTVIQKPMKVVQLNILMKEFAVLKKIDLDVENAKWGGKKRNGKKPRRR